MSKEFDLFYLAYLLRSTSIRQKIILLAQGISRYNISKKGLMEIYIPIPVLDEQKLIGLSLNKTEKLITLHQRELESQKKMMNWRLK